MCPRSTAQLGCYLFAPDLEQGRFQTVGPRQEELSSAGLRLPCIGRGSFSPVPASKIRISVSPLNRTNCDPQPLRHYRLCGVGLLARDSLVETRAAPIVAFPGGLGYSFRKCPEQLQLRSFSWWFWLPGLLLRLQSAP